MPTNPPTPVRWDDNLPRLYAEEHKLDKVTWLATTPFGILAGFENNTSRIIDEQAPPARMPLKAKYR